MKKYLSLLIVMMLLLVPVKNDTRPVASLMAEPMFSMQELTCLAKNIYYEAPEEPYLGKLAVATVTMNRVRHPEFPKTVCDVVYQKNRRGCQFSWTCGPKARLNEKLYQQSLEIAKAVLTNNIGVVSLENALYFHNTHVSPNWSFARPVVRIGGHIFYEPIT
jgi:spore germination cell wall hydrolase CwlJ-like protein